MFSRKGKRIAELEHELSIAKIELREAEGRARGAYSQAEHQTVLADRMANARNQAVGALAIVDYYRREAEEELKRRGIPTPWISSSRELP